MKTKIIPFDLEIAKDIQAGKIKGRILCANGVRARVVEFNMVGSTDIVVVRGTVESGIEWCYPYKKDGCFIDGYLNGSTGYDLIIELPEEAPMQDSFNKKLHDTTEVLATPKHEFKVGDKVKFAGSEKILQIINIEGECAKLIDPKDTEHIVYVGRLDTLHLVISKPQFKPFDKVLVRGNDASLWRAGFYSHELDGKHCVSGDYYKQCIPYEGNEHLLGTTVNPIPKEE